MTRNFGQVKIILGSMIYDLHKQLVTMHEIYQIVQKVKVLPHNSSVGSSIRWYREYWIVATD